MVMGLLIMRSLLCSVWKSDVRVIDFWSRLWRREMLDLDIKSLAYQSHSFSFCVIFVRVFSFFPPYVLCLLCLHCHE